MKLLENLLMTYHPISGTWVLTSECFGYTIYTKPTRPLTIPEKVEYLYQKCLNGTAKEYREILDWIYGILNSENAHVESNFNLTMQGIDISADEASVLWCKSIINQALAKQE